MMFSIVMPAHNDAAHIRMGLDSIKAQTFTDYELIVVCDACTDNTADIAREYTDKVYEVDYELDGLTRNYGIDRATGEWLLFMDSDDWWLHEYVLDMIAKNVGKHGEDILRFSFIWKGKGYTPCGDWPAVWNKVWRRSLVGETRFSAIKYWSDLDFHNAMKEKRPRIYDWDMPFYYYNFMREGSINWINS